MKGKKKEYMRKPIKTISVFIKCMLIYTISQGQIETTILEKSPVMSPQKAIFFTNRPLIINEDSTITFQNKFTDKSNTLYFCSYQYDTDSIEVFYKAVNSSDKYPSEKLAYNFMYDVYKYHRLERGIKNFYTIVGGYGKSFEKQVHSYMKRIKAAYGDTLFNKALISVFAWGTEDDAYQYYHAVREAKKGASDFAIYQHMLDEFVSDSVFFADNPRDFKINIVFSSMANKLFLEYLENRKKQGIPLIKAYNNITFLGSVAPRDSFEEGKAFYNLNQMTDSVKVFVNSKDILLKMSSAAELKNRLGNKGPKNEEELPDYIKVYHIKDIITKKDMSGLGHDYLLTNDELHDIIIKRLE
jgi:hypothetical protein